MICFWDTLADADKGKVKEKETNKKRPPNVDPFLFSKTCVMEKTEKACARTAVVHLLRDLNAEQKQKRQLVILISPESWQYLSLFGVFVVLVLWLDASVLDQRSQRWVVWCQGVFSPEVFLVGLASEAMVEG